MVYDEHERPLIDDNNQMQRPDERSVFTKSIQQMQG